MSKYNEIMDHVRITEEMRGRILDGIEEKISDNQKTERKSGRSIMVIAACAAASLLIVAVPAYFFRMTPDDHTGPSVEKPEETTVSYTVSESAVSDWYITESTSKQTEGGITLATSAVSETAYEYTASSAAAAPDIPPSAVPAPQTVTELPHVSKVPEETPLVTEKETEVFIPPVTVVTTEENPDVQGPPVTTDSVQEEKSYSSLEEMEEATGYRLSHLKLDFNCDFTEYYSYGGIPEIEYFGENGETVFYRTHTEPGDHSGYSGYERKQVYNLNRTEVTISSVYELCSVAVWNDGTYWHSMAVFWNTETGFHSDENILKIIEAQM